MMCRMVEGPGCKLKGEKMKAKVVGQKGVRVSGASIYLSILLIQFQRGCIHYSMISSWILSCVYSSFY